MSTRDELLRLVNDLPKSEVAAALRYMQFLLAQYGTAASSEVVSDLDDEEHELEAEVEDEFAITELDTRPSAKDWGYGGVENTIMTTYDVTYRGRTLRMAVHDVIEGREAYGTVRRRILVTRGTGDVMVEFAGADDFQRSRRLFAVLKAADGTQVKDEDEIPANLREFKVEPIAELARDGINRRGLAIVVNEADRKAMIRVGALRWLEKNVLL